MTEQTVPVDVVRAAAERNGVCVRPILQRLMDFETGESSVIPIPCGSTRERVCPPCAAKARAVRIQQCREGWHGGPAGIDVPDLTGLSLAEARAQVRGIVSLSHPHAGPLAAAPGVVVTGERYTPDVVPGTVLDQAPAPDDRIAPGDDIAVVVATDEDRGPGDGLPTSDDPDDENDTPDNDDGEEEGEGSARRVRSTRRRQDVPDLPNTAPRQSTVGRVFHTSRGPIRPGMFCTLTLDSYGPVRADGTPVSPATYDYRRAALDNMHLPKLFGHWVRVVRRKGGLNAQYFAAIEPQKRLALHVHVAIRGVIPRWLMRAITQATYYQLWWPMHDRPVYTGDRLPVWSDTEDGYVDPATGEKLPTWDQALDQLDTDCDEPAHVVRFGAQFDYQGVAPTNHAEVNRTVGYLTKYLTKSIADAYDADTATARQKAHRDRLAEETRWLPCSPECANWLRFGVQPKNCEAGMRPGECSKSAHDPENLGHGGRRVLVSRDWSGKRLPEHRADRGRVVRAALSAIGIDPPEADRCSATATAADGGPRYAWEPLDPDEHADIYADVLHATVAERIRWRNEYQAAKAARAGPDPHSATRTGRINAA